MNEEAEDSYCYVFCAWLGKRLHQIWWIFQHGSFMTFVWFFLYATLRCKHKIHACTAGGPLCRRDQSACRGAGRYTSHGTRHTHEASAQKRTRASTKSSRRGGGGGQRVRGSEGHISEPRTFAITEMREKAAEAKLVMAEAKQQEFRYAT